MFCKRCGGELEGSPSFCPRCGEQIAEEISEKRNVFSEKIKSNSRLPVIAAVTACAILAAIVLFRGTGYQKVLDDYYEVFEDRDAEKMYSSVIARYWTGYMEDGWEADALEILEEDK